MGQHPIFKYAFSALVGLLPLSSPAAVQDKPNDGTDPTRLVSQASLTLEHLDLRGGLWTDTINADLTLPFGDGDRNSIRLRTPLVATNAGSSNGFALGDLGLRYTRVLDVKPTHGWVAQAEFIADTASRPELGTGKNVAKATLIYARFLKGGSIFAPAVVHSRSIWGSGDRSTVSMTTIDFYFVPKLANPSMYMTLDPSLNFDWTNDRTYGAAAVTVGYRLGPTLGGMTQVFVKPTIAVGSERTLDWGLQGGIQLLGF